MKKDKHYKDETGHWEVSMNKLNQKKEKLKVLLQCFQDQISGLLNEDLDAVDRCIADENRIMQEISNLQVDNDQECLQILNEIQKLHNTTLSRMNIMKEDVNEKINKLHQNRELIRGNKQYLNPFEQASQTSYFIDFKK